jgi:hypothetical protein
MRSDHRRRACAQGAGPNVTVPQRRGRLDPDAGRYRSLSAAQKQVNTAHARQRGAGERLNAQLKSWKILRKMPSQPVRLGQNGGGPEALANDQGSSAGRLPSSPDARHSG